ncbi:unnamed protein product [Phytophthora lilii]|uniref:Unnamed protein product n=1 Tax=Phytophthora lilii TaxID=2077276 RepID=A0A9W6XEP0_9STRA|nr:unnamed protein product [Phytophthora lilii]
MSDAAPRAAKRKRVVLSIHDKQQVLQRLDAGEQPVAIARAFGISRQQVSDIKKNRPRILAFCMDAKHMSSLARKTLKPASEFHPGVEQELYRWIVRQRALGRRVSAESLSSKTAALFTQYSAEASGMSPKGIANWLRHFKRAHGIKTFSEEEVMQLPERFVPAMDTTRSEVPAIQSQASTPSSTVTASSADSVTPPGSYYITTASHTISQPVDSGINALNAAAATIPSSSTAVSVPASMDMDSYVHGVGAYANAQQLQHPAIGGPTATLQATVNTAQQLSEQLVRFERDMEAKLNYLDERVAKLCYLVLPTRLS